MYWPNSTNTTANTTTLTESNVQTQQQQQQQYLTPSANGYSDTYETALKDFNTAFRITPTPYASPAHEVELSSEDSSEDKGINWGSVLSLSSQSELHDPLNNNSFVSEPWISPPSTVTSGSTSAPPPAGSTSPTGSDEGSDDGSSNGSDDSGTGGHSYSEAAVASTAATSGGDIGWKLSADDVIRAFPTTEGRS